MDNFPALPFEEAIAWAKSRGVLLPEVYYGQLQGFARAAAFSVAGTASIAQLHGVKEALVEALAEGKTFEQWQKTVPVESLALPKHRLDNIFRTNIQGEYARGRCEQQRRNYASHPYLMYDAVNDSRTRPAHAAMDGFVARYDDPIWQTWRPPCGYRCRCRVIALSEAQALRFIQADQRRTQDPEKFNARAQAITQGPDLGWDYDVCQEPEAGIKRAVEETLKQVQPESLALANTLKKIVEKGAAAEARYPTAVSWENLPDDILTAPDAAEGLFAAGAYGNVYRRGGNVLKVIRDWDKHLRHFATWEKGDPFWADPILVFDNEAAVMKIATSHGIGPALKKVYMREGHVFALEMEDISGAETLRKVLTDVLVGLRPMTVDALEGIRVSMVKQVEALHTVGIAHNDLHWGNVLVRQDNTPILIDFGLSSIGEGVSTDTLPLLNMADKIRDIAAEL